MKSVILAVNLMLLLGFSASAQQPQTAVAADDILIRCAGGRVLGVEGEIKAELNRYLAGASASGVAKLSDLGAIIDKLKPDGVGVEFYRLYTQCLKEQAEIKLKQFNVKVLDKLSEIDDRVRAQPLTFPKSLLSGATFVRKVKVGTTYDTRIRIFDAACDIYVWGAMWVFPLDRVGEPVIKLAMTESGRIARDYPFEWRFDIASKVVDDAGRATREALPQDVKQNDFILYSLTHPRETLLYIAFRPASNTEDCAGSYLIDYVPKIPQAKEW